MKELSVFIDESGDFGAYERHSPLYIVTLVFHDQSVDITKNINHLNTKILDYGLPKHTIHTGPLIRRENEYFHLSILDRKRIFNALYNFARTTDISYHSLIVEKKQLVEKTELVTRLTKQLSAFLFARMEFMMKYDRIVGYYDYGQRELANILIAVFNTYLNHVVFRKVTPSNYKLFQVTDMLCTLELLTAKEKRKLLSNSELSFFSSARDLNKSYLRAMQKKRLV